MIVRLLSVVIIAVGYIVADMRVLCAFWEFATFATSYVTQPD